MLCVEQEEKEVGYKNTKIYCLYRDNFLSFKRNKKESFNLGKLNYRYQGHLLQLKKHTEQSIQEIGENFKRLIFREIFRF